MDDEEGRELRRRFAALKSDEADAAPPFQRVWAAARTARRPRLGARFAVAAGALGLLALLWLRPGPTPDSTGSASVAQWRSPTDFLLETPGRELLSAVPAIGVTAVIGLCSPARSPEPSNPPTKGVTS